MGKNKLSLEEVEEKLSETVTQLVEDHLGEELAGILQPLIPAAVRLAAEKGIGVAIDALQSLAREDPYQSFSVLIQAATPEQRRTIMEQARVAAVQAVARRLESEDKLWEVLAIALRVAASLLALLLV